MAKVSAQSEFESWAIQQTNIQKEDVIKSNAGLIVIDISSDGSETHEFDAAEITKMRTDGKRVIASLSVGRAEPWRWYWNGQWEIPRIIPCYELRFDTRKREWRRENTCPTGNFGLVGTKDPLWDGGLAAHYWDELWYDDVIEPYLEKVLAARFDGVYLTNTDTFAIWGNRSATKRTYAREMERLIVRIAQHVRERAGEDFLVIVEDGDQLLASSRDTNLNRTLLQTIDALALKSLVFDTTSVEQKRRIALLQQFVGARLQILVSECAPNSANNTLREWQKRLLLTNGLRTIFTLAGDDCRFDSLSQPIGE